MAAPASKPPDKPIMIAPAPPRLNSDGNGVAETVSMQFMPYSCQTCGKRKVKCDKTKPACSSCRKSKLHCVYQAPAPRKSRKRKLSDGLDTRLAEYERVMPQDVAPGRDGQQNSSNAVSLDGSLDIPGWKADEPFRSGTLLAGEGKSRYIVNAPWGSLADNMVQALAGDDYDEDGSDAVGSLHDEDPAADIAPDPLTGSLMGLHQKLLPFHPSHEDAVEMWKIHTQNVEPLCKILHIPTMSALVERVSRHPATASKAEECLLFAVYHFAVTALTEADCTFKFSQSRDSLLKKYHFAAKQALINASFLKTTEMTIMQSFVLFLLASRNNFDAQTFWILTGVAMRIAMRMGLHKEVELPPFETEMRRRLFFQLLPLDGTASRMAGTPMTFPDDWNTLLPANLNDDQIWPGMTEHPIEPDAATDMIFCRTRYTIGSSMVKSWKLFASTDAAEPKDLEVVEQPIRETENYVEEKFIRYCDVVKPLHLLTVAMARSAITAMRLRLRSPRVKNKLAVEAERREVYSLSQSILDTDSIAYGHKSLHRYLWHIKMFFVYGSWDSLIITLMFLKQNDLLTPSEVEDTWARLVQVYENHPELLEHRHALHIGVGRMALKTWDDTGRGAIAPEPEFIQALRARAKTTQQRIERRKEAANNASSNSAEAVDSMNSSLTGDLSTFPDDITPYMDDLMSTDFTLDSTDWTFWDQLIQDHQALSS